MGFGNGQKFQYHPYSNLQSKHNILGSIIITIISRTAMIKDFDFELTSVDLDTNHI